MPRVVKSIYHLQVSWKPKTSRAFPRVNFQVIVEMALQGKHLVAKVFTELPRQIYPFLFIAEVDSGGRWLEVFAVVF